MRHFTQTLCTQPMHPKTFVIAFFGTLASVCMGFLTILYYLSHIYEHNSFSTIVTRQQKNGSMYGTLLNENVFGYKLELIRQTKPDIIALGSSRVLQFRQEYFTTSFGNAGNAMNTLKEGEYFLEEILKIYKPQLIILGLDFWFFSPYFTNFRDAPYHTITGTGISAEKILTILQLIAQGEFFHLHYIVDNHFITNPYTTLDSLGLNAINKGRGFLPDGSYVYGEVFEKTPTKDVHFANTLQRIEQGNSRFEYAKTVDMTRITDLLKILSLLEQNNIKVVLFIPPIAPSIYTAMQEKAENYGYIDELFATMKALNLKVFNYHNPNTLHNDDCEFIDGFHGGDVYYARILQDMAKQNSLLKEHTNFARLQTIITTQNGKALAKTSISPHSEQDFLNLGCKK